MSENKENPVATNMNDLLNNTKLIFKSQYYDNCTTERYIDGSRAVVV